MNIDIIGAGWSNGFGIHASLFRIVDGDDINYRMNLENSFTGKVATRWYDDRGVAEREMRDILYDGKMTTDWDWR